MDGEQWTGKSEQGVVGMRQPEKSPVVIQTFSAPKSSQE